MKGSDSHRGVMLPVIGLVWASALVAGGRAAGFFPGDGGLPVPTTLEDFFLPGTQPGGVDLVPIFDSNNCVLCHADFDKAEPPLPPDAEPYRNWLGGMMAQATRDPVSWAAISIANQDADFGGDLCLRCHTPGGWLAGRSVPTDGTGLMHPFELPGSADFEGVTCHFCHRMVNINFVPGESPDVDEEILDDLDMEGLLPLQHGTGQYVVDPEDRRRGPFDLGDFFYHQWLQSPFHRDSALCGTCHDVSNPLYTRQLDDTYVFNALDMQHDTLDKFDMFPVERTYSEWLNSDFGNGGVQMNGRFGGNHPTGVMESCQDCHMPDQVSPGCRVPGFPDRPDLGAHFLNGGNTWVLNAINDLYTDGDPDEPNGIPEDDVFLDEEPWPLTQDMIDDALARQIDFLQLASDMELTQDGNLLNVRVINMCGHKLPTGYPEGRRVWINVKFLDVDLELIYELGAYDFGKADLDEETTKVYQAKLGIDAAVAGKTGLPEGESFHFILNNVILFDNRIPPIGFTNAGFEAVQAEPVGYSYADGQHWDDTSFIIPPDTFQAVVTIYFQLTSREYIEFLRDEVQLPDNRGLIAYDQWEKQGKSAPVDMDMGSIELAPILVGDLDNDGVVDITDFLGLLANWGPCPAPCPPICPGDLDGDCDVGIEDFLLLLANWTF